MYPRRLGAGRHGAAPSLRPVTRSARRHGGNTNREGRACRVRWGGRTPTGCGLDKYETGGTRLSRPMGGTDADGVRPRQARPSRVLDLYDNPIISRPLSIRSFPVPLQWVKQRVSQPQNQSPCPRASACSVLTGRRPRDVPAPPRRVALGGGPEPPAGHTERAETRRKYETGGTRLSRPMGGRTPTGCGRDKRVPPAVSFTAYHGWTLPCFFSRSCPSPVAFSSALSGRVSSSRTFRAGSSPCRAALS